MLIPLLGVVISHSLILGQESWQSSIVYYGPEDTLVYKVDGEGNRIPDFSYAGYRNCEVPIPDIPVVKTISPIEGDNTSHIQSALLEVGLMARNEDGFRGALLLSAGVYEVRGTIEVGVDGVGLRGVGDGADPDSNTILYATGNTPDKRTVLVAGGGTSTMWADSVLGTTTDIVSDSVMVGSRTFEVADASPFIEGDNIIIYHPCTAEWLTAIDTGGTHWNSPGAEPDRDVPWKVGQVPLVFNRYITDIQGNTITIDAPVFNHLIKSLSQSYIYKYARDSIRTHIGIEDLRIDIESIGGADEEHAWNAIDLYLIEDVWVRDCTVLGFGLSGVRTSTATRVTVENCRAIDPVSAIEGAKRYNFNVYKASQLILFKNCHATNGRHHYVSNGKSRSSGCVFVDCTSEGAYTSSQGHRHWSTGLLFDNLVELDGPRPEYDLTLLGLYNRGHMGTSHGWATAHSVAWACDMNEGDLIVQKPPTAQNYAIGCFGKNVTGISPPAPFDEPEGYIEGTNLPGLHPRSLFYAQLEQRLGVPMSASSERDKSMIHPNQFTLHQNYPNPFNPTTSLRFDLPKTGNVALIIYNVMGREVARLVDGYMEPGYHQAQWDRRSAIGRELPSGIYIARLVAPEYSKSIKMVLLK
jgi:hypothetical protein